VSSLFQGGDQGPRPYEDRSRPTIVADERSNTVLISSDQSQRLRLRALVVSLDTPLPRSRFVPAPGGIPSAH
jgi:hypothetical protein